MSTQSTSANATFVDTLASAVGERHRELGLVAALLGSTFFMVALIGYDPADPTWLHPGDTEVLNPCGPLGALLADAAFQVVGHGAWGAFGLMVACIMALAGRLRVPVVKTVVGASGYLMLLALMDLALPTSTAPFFSGGFVGRGLSGVLQDVLGLAGAWLAVGGSMLLQATVVFDIRWSKVATLLIQRIEAWVPIVRHSAGQRSAQMRSAVARTGRAGATRFGALSRAGWGRAWGSVKRMGRALTRREGDMQPDEAWGGSLDALAVHPAGLIPSDAGDPTAVGMPVAVAEVEWEPTHHVSAASSEVLDLFPDLAPRPSSIEPMDEPLRGDTVVDREAPTSPSDAPPSVAVASAAFMPEAEPVAASAGLPMSTPMMASAPSSPDGLLPVSESYPSDLTPSIPLPEDQVAKIAAGQASAPVAKVAVATPAASPARVAAPTAAASSAQVAVPASVNAAPASAAAIKIREADALQQGPAKDNGRAVRKARRGEFQSPGLKLLDLVPPQQAKFDPQRLREQAALIEETLEAFKVRGQVTDVRVGPVVTTFEYQPERGISVKRIGKYADDLAMAMMVESVRVELRSERGVIGIEIPSEQRMTIFLRELLAAPEFRDQKMALPCVIGKDVDGRPVVSDLAKMPHLLVGGTTGSGKSVGVNGMLMSMLFTRTPEELRLLLVDPKILEFKMYEEIPHLLHPVVTEPSKAAAALAWACREMDERYALLAAWDTRNIAGYNEKVKRELKSGWNFEKSQKYCPEGGDPVTYDPCTLPYIVIVIDELADLMMQAKKDVEESIARIAQKARAAGIHLIVATQRPSADVVTGLIKSNLPTRLSFKLKSGLDSRVILDCNGAESLLGKGDCLLSPNGSEIMRCHGAFVSDDEVGRVVEHLRSQGEPEYIEAVTQEVSDVDDFADDDLDALYDSAVAFVREKGKASTSMVQRQFKIGYNRAARIIDQMESRGVVGPPDGARPREVL